MYIPTSYFSSQGSCITTTTSIVNGNGKVTSGSFYSSSQVYNWLKFEMNNITSSALTSLTASLTISTGSTLQGRLLVVGGGGSGTTTGSFVYQSQTYVVNSAAGGGGGGVVEYYNFPLTPGVYEIGVGAASPRANTTFLTGSKGNSSYFKNIYTYTPFTTPYITAEGGGTGNIRGTVSGVNGATYVINGENGGCGGGASTTYRNQAFPAYQAALSGTLGQPNFGGLANGRQGYNGGNYLGGDSSAGGGNGHFGIGGGGAGSRGVDGGSGSILPSDKATNGGSGVTKLISGSSVVLSGGGGGASFNSAGTGITNPVVGTRGSTSYGAGGNGNTGVSTVESTLGNSGLVYIEWPLCTNEYSNCTQYNVYGGAAGGTISFIPCGTTTITSSVIEADITTSLCTKAVLSYPSTTGTVTLSTVGNCNEFIPIPPQVTCPISGTIKTALNTYDWTNANNPVCYPRPDYCAMYYYSGTTIYYYDEYNILQSQYVAGGFSPSYVSVCAKNNPAPYSTYNGNLTASVAVCNYYCATTSSNALTTNGLVLQVNTTSLTGSVWYDRSGNGNNALVSGSALSLSGSLGYAFNGTNNYLTFPTNLVATPSSSYCLQWWGSAPVTSSSSNSFLFSKGGYANGWDSIYRPTDKSLVFRDNAGSDRVYVTSYSGSTKALFTMNITSDLTLGNNIGSFYFNKTGSLNRIPANTFNSASVPLRFGYNVTGDASLFNGTVSALAVYNRMLTPEEIENNYNYFNNNF